MTWQKLMGAKEDLFNYSQASYMQLLSLFHYLIKLRTECGPNFRVAEYSFIFYSINRNQILSEYLLLKLNYVQLLGYILISCINVGFIIALQQEELCYNTIFAYNVQPLTTKYHPYEFAAKDDVADAFHEKNSGFPLFCIYST